MPVRSARTDLPAELTRVSFVGRQAELAHLCRMLEQARQGRPGLVLVEGSAGIGKTALVRRFLEVAGEPYVLWASGEEAEIGLSLGVLGQVVTLVPATPPHSRAAKQTDEHVVDPLAAGAALLELLGELQHGGPVVLVVDDAHWADHPSLQALTFALRRLRVDRVLTLVLVRDVADPHLPDGLRRLLTSDQTLHLTLHGLPAAELRDLSSQLGPRRLSLSAAERLRAHTHGNPLHARALLEELPATAFEASDSPLPAPRSFAMVVLARLTACAKDVQGLVVAASVLGIRCRLDQAAALAEVADPLFALEQAIAAGLLVEDPDTGMVEFPHPLVHAAVYRQLGPSRRPALHTRAATMTTDEASRLRHRVRAASGLDPQLAGELAGLGRRAAGRGDWAAAGDQLATAGRLTPAGAEREQLALEAVECQLLTGQAPDAAVLAGQLRSFPASGWRSYILARVAFVTARMEAVEGLLQDAWHRCNPDIEAALAARIAGLLATLYVLQGRGRDGAEWASRALHLAPEQLATDMLRCLPLIGLGSSGQAEAALTSLGPLPAPTLATVAELDVLLGRGLLRLWTDDLTGARQDLSGVLSAGHDRSAVFRVSAADLLANVEYRLGCWGDARVHSELALSIAEDADQKWAVPLCHATAATIAAAQGRLEQASAHAQTGQRAAAAGCFMPLAYAATAAAQVARARRQPEAVIATLDPLRRLSGHEGVAEPVVGWQDLLADALVAVGDYEQADTVLASFEALAAARGRRSALATAARARGNLEAARGNHQAAEAAFQAALGHAAQVPIPFEQARSQLAYGGFLRRAGKRRLAADQLRAARVTFSRLDARPDLEHCDRELAGCGLAPMPPGATGQPELSPQELAVARLVASGLTNRQVARELVVSVKTVEYHLSRVYAKLQVTSRVQLAARLSQD